MTSRWKSYLRMVPILFAVVFSMAVACPQPDPPGPINGNGLEETKSPARLAFEKVSVEGYYHEGGCLLRYDETSFQRAVNASRRSVRIQADDQSRYMHLVFTDRIPEKVGDETVCRITFTPEGSEEVTLIVKLMTVRIDDTSFWLWNELQTIGILIDIDLQDDK